MALRHCAWAKKIFGTNALNETLHFNHTIVRNQKAGECNAFKMSTSVKVVLCPIAFLKLYILFGRLIWEAMSLSTSLGLFTLDICVCIDAMLNFDGDVDTTAGVKCEQSLRYGSIVTCCGPSLLVSVEDEIHVGESARNPVLDDVTGIAVLRA